MGKEPLPTPMSGALSMDFHSVSRKELEAIGDQWEEEPDAQIPSMLWCEHTEPWS